MLNLDDVDNCPSIGTVLETAEFYELDKLEAKQIAEEVISVVANWKEVAKRAGIANAEVELMEAAFMKYD